MSASVLPSVGIAWLACARGDERCSTAASDATRVSEVFPGVSDAVRGFVFASCAAGVGPRPMAEGTPSENDQESTGNRRKADGELAEN
jgi:hypothetical protein